MKESVQSPSRLQSRITTAVQSPAKIRAQCWTVRRELRPPNRKSDIRRESRIPPCGSGNTPYAAISPADRRKADKPKSTCIRKCFFGAATQIRTGDLILTKDVLYHLSHISKNGDPERARTVDL